VDTKSGPPWVYFHYDGFPRRELAADAMAFLADIAAGRLIVTASGVTHLDVPQQEGGA
jgi:hypothetical protein